MDEGYWQQRIQWLSRSTCLSTIEVGEMALSCRQYIDNMRVDRQFRSWFSARLRDFSAPACFFEVRPLRQSDLDLTLEFVLKASPALDCSDADCSTFADWFRAGESCAQFPNLTGDAMLLAPSISDEHTDYRHLLSFLRSAGDDQIDALWKDSFDAVANRLSDAPLWLSTSGLGVAWLHLRMDSFPKYYTYQPFRDPTY